MTPPRSLPIFWQVLGLSLAVLVLALGINTLIVLKAPDPPAPGYSVSEVARALKGSTVKLRSGQTLTSTAQTQAPDFVSDMRAGGGPPHLQDAVAAQIASVLGVPRDRIQVRMDDHMRWQHRNAPRVEARVYVMRQPPGDGGMPGQMGPDQAGPDMPPPGMRPDVRIETSLMQVPQDLGLPPFSVAWRLDNGSYRVITPPRTWIAPWQARLLMGFAITALLVLPLAWLLARNLSRPIAAFSDAAAHLGFESGSPPVVTDGPREVRRAAEVLNAMQARIKTQVETRTALMGAIAHDLKTPLARMRLRIEDLADPLRTKLGQDISHMDGLITSAMSFTSAHRLTETLRPLDLSALIGALHDDLVEVYALEPPLIEERIMVKGDAVALKRIVTNLVENAARYAGGCRLQLATRADRAELIVADNGPGLPAGELDAVFEPFYRLEASRNRDTGGAGLGLSVARALAEAHGGTLRLTNRYAGTQIVGCDAQLSLPRLVRR